MLPNVTGYNKHYRIQGVICEHTAMHISYAQATVLENVFVPSGVISFMFCKYAFAVAVDTLVPVAAADVSRGGGGLGAFLPICNLLVKAVFAPVVVAKNVNGFRFIAPS